MVHHLRLTLGYGIGLLIAVLSIGILGSYHLRSAFNRQVSALQLQERSLLEYDLLRAAGDQLVESAALAPRAAGEERQPGFDIAADHARMIAADLRLQSSPSAAALSRALEALEVAARAAAGGRPDAARLAQAQTEFSRQLEAYSAEQLRHRQDLISFFDDRDLAATYSGLALATVCLVVAWLLYILRTGLITPLRLVGRALEAVGRGDLTHPLPQRMPAEFAPIIDGYHAMREVLGDRQRALALQLRRTSLLTQISIELRGTLDPQTIVERVLRVLGNNLGIDDATIVLTPEDSQPLGVRWADGGLQQLSPTQIAHLLTHGLEGRVQRQQSNIVLADVCHAERWQAGGGAGEGSAMALVLLQDELTLGSLSIYNRRANAFSNHDLLLLEGIVAQTSVALSLSLRFQAERRHSERLEALIGRRTNELRRSRDLLRVVFDHLPEGLLLLDAEGVVLAANSAFCRNIIGRTPQATVSQRYAQIWRELAQASELTLTPQGPAEDGVPLLPPEQGPFPLVAASWRVLSTDIVGQQRWYAVDRFPIDGMLEVPAQCLERWRDITQQEELQRRLLVHEQLSSLGRLAASIAHEVGNPLQSALGCLELCRDDQGLSQLSREYLDLALGELDRMARTMANLRNLYRPPQISWEPVNLNQLIHQVAQFTRRQLEHGKIRLVLQLDGELPTISGQSDALRQVLLNLVLNAQQAMANGGEIQITTTRKFTDRSCQLTIHDSGRGMSAEQLDHIFEPFRSAKAQGVGLGLYLSKQIIEQHTGRIAITSLPGQGTTVTIQFPWSDAGPWRPAPEQALIAP